jgi:hypothetical protein
LLDIPKSAKNKDSNSMDMFSNVAYYRDLKERCLLLYFINTKIIGMNGSYMFRRYMKMCDVKKYRSNVETQLKEMRLEINQT